MSTRMSFHSSVGISDRRRSISASPVETIWMTAAWPCRQIGSMLAISVGVFIEVRR
jgi:hypothetical protein